MVEITLENLEIRFDFVCRFCLSDADCFPVFLPDGNINNQLQKAFEIIASKVDENDGLPNNICGGCLQSIEDFVEFEANCSKSYEILMKIIHDASKIVSGNTACLDFGSENQIKSEHDDEIVLEDIESSQYIYNDGGEIPGSLAPEDDSAVALEVDYEELLDKDGDKYENSTTPTGESTAIQVENVADKSENEESHTDFMDLPDGLPSNDMYIKACNAPVMDYWYRKNRKIPIVQCMFCDKTYRGRNTLRKHLKIHFHIKNYSCPSCERTFSDRTSLRIHESRHSNTKSFKCDHCDRCYYSKAELKQHCIVKHGTRKHICEVCNKPFPSRTILQDHAQVHASERPFVCSTCGKSFKRSRNLVRHYQNHEKSKNNTAEKEPTDAGNIVTTCQYCNDEFGKPSALLEHLIQKHPDEYEQSREESRSCSICGTTFNDMEKFLLHQDKHVLLIVTAGGYQCGKCGKQLRYRSLAEKHLQSHSTERSFQCDIADCLKRYKLKVHLTRHKRLAH
ncbi:zinc finger protein ZFP2-like [Anopheles marshallii]|uniref:zinc finger protein ZFP2-like n=1 Tax=Anopheles marshallii TaxID=1521116 RepID=UPI00237BE0CA|nr:zinc finger protein ZFP2-like [Anopheles marshallii]